MSQLASATTKCHISDAGLQKMQNSKYIPKLLERESLCSIIFFIKKLKIICILLVIGWDISVSSLKTINYKLFPLGS